MWEGSGILPGGGATELTLANHLLTLPYISPQIRLIRESFAQALQEIAITLLKNNGGCNVATEFAHLQMAHREGKRWGMLLLPDGTVTCGDPLAITRHHHNRNQQQHQHQQSFGVAEVTKQRIDALRLATHTALAILRVDHFFISSK
jgi:chaperonin GroEL (HSP60 family)